VTVLNARADGGPPTPRHTTSSSNDGRSVEHVRQPFAGRGEDRTDAQHRGPPSRRSGSTRGLRVCRFGPSVAAQPIRSGGTMRLSTTCCRPRTTHGQNYRRSASRTSLTLRHFCSSATPAALRAGGSSLARPLLPRGPRRDARRRAPSLPCSRRSPARDPSGLPARWQSYSIGASFVRRAWRSAAGPLGRPAGSRQPTSSVAAVAATERDDESRGYPRLGSEARPDAPAPPSVEAHRNPTRRQK
jgi:hypothetical protein